MKVLQRRHVHGIGLVAVIAVGAAACGGSYGTGKAAAPPSQSTVVRAQSATVGGKSVTILTDGQGRPLYYFAPDSAGKSRVTGRLAGLWPPVTASTKPTSAGLGGKVDVVPDEHGRQVAYNGHLLYTFVSDSKGVVTGQGEENFFVATPDLAPLSGVATATTTTGGYSYGGY